LQTGDREDLSQKIPIGVIDERVWYRSCSPCEVGRLNAFTPSKVITKFFKLQSHSSPVVPSGMGFIGLVESHGVSDFSECPLLPFDFGCDDLTRYLYTCCRIRPRLPLLYAEISLRSHCGQNQSLKLTVPVDDKNRYVVSIEKPQRPPVTE